MWRTALLMASLAGPAVAQDGPSFDCAKAESSAEKLVCSDAALTILDRRLADRYAAALKVAGGLDAGAAEAEGELKAYQRGWVKGRDECWKEADVRACVQQTYLRREGELVASWLLEPAQATARWMCDGNPANEIVTTFFATELPSVRIEYGDSVDTGSLTPAASGARYEASFGRWFWEKGDTAMATMSEGTEMSCVRAD
jgi:uncharacterized protein YecT (DUF1311 family)